MQKVLMFGTATHWKILDVVQAPCLCCHLPLHLGVVLMGLLRREAVCGAEALPYLEARVASRNCLAFLCFLWEGVYEDVNMQGGLLALYGVCEECYCLAAVS